MTDDEELYGLGDSLITGGISIIFIFINFGVMCWPIFLLSYYVYEKSGLIKEFDKPPNITI